MEYSVNIVVSAVKEITGLIDRQMAANQKTSQESQEVAAIARERLRVRLK